MTSSLVGSEMCIRDRSNSVPLRPSRPHFSPHCNLVKQWDHPRQGICPGTVSYTHLTLPTICSV
eukprot:10278051-Prorocentrum_lima.AAC.1